jgi:hypothetical protein
MDENDDGGAGEQFQRLDASLDDDVNGSYSPVTYTERNFFLSSMGFSDVGDGYRDEGPDYASSSHIPSG